MQSSIAYDHGIVAVTRAVKRTRTTGLGLLLFLSGTAALIYQLLWIKQLSLIVGVDVYAVTTAVSAFFGGLALGSAIFGRTAETVRRPLAIYTALELGVAVLGFAATVALSHAARPFAVLEEHLGIIAWLLPFALVGVPATLMGGTLPVLVKAVSPAPGAVGRAGGGLYAANTAGAIAGALLVPFVLVPAFGVRGSAIVAAALNLAAAAGARALGLQSHNVEGSQSQATARSKGLGARRSEDETVARSQGLKVQESKGVANALWMYAVAGGIALGYEVVWSQAIVPFVSTRAFAFSIVLATYLGGLAIGSALYARVADRVRDPWGTFGVLIASAGLVALLLVAGLGTSFMARQSSLEEAVRAATSSELVAMCARFALAAVAMVFVPTLLLGAAFPAALRLGATANRLGRDVGRILALNTAGGIVGTLATGFVLLPALGIVRTLGALAVGAAALGLVAAFQGHSVARASRVVIVAIAAIALLTALVTPEDRIARLLTVRTRRHARRLHRESRWHGRGRRADGRRRRLPAPLHSKRLELGRCVAVSALHAAASSAAPARASRRPTRRARHWPWHGHNRGRATALPHPRPARCGGAATGRRPGGTPVSRQLRCDRRTVGSTSAYGTGGVSCCEAPSSTT